MQGNLLQEWSLYSCRKHIKLLLHFTIYHYMCEKVGTATDSIYTSQQLDSEAPKQILKQSFPCMTLLAGLSLLMQDETCMLCSLGRNEVERC